MSTIAKRKIHRQLAETYALFSRYLGAPGKAETHGEYVARVRRVYERARTRSVPILRRQIGAVRRAIRRAVADADLFRRFRDLIDIEPPPGWQDRAIERARSEGVLAPEPTNE